MFDPERSVLFVADSWALLRRCDVYRLFNSHDPDHWTPIYRALKRHRPDLVDEAREVMADLESDLHTEIGHFSCD